MPEFSAANISQTLTNITLHEWFKLHDKHRIQLTKLIGDAVAVGRIKRNAPNHEAQTPGQNRSPCRRYAAVAGPSRPLAT